MKDISYFLIMFLLPLFLAPLLPGSHCLGYDPTREPWKTMTSEARLLEDQAELVSFNETEQKYLSKDGQVLGVKLVVDSQNYTVELGNQTSQEYVELVEDLLNGLKEVFGQTFPQSTNFAGIYQFVGVQNYKGLPLLFFYLENSGNPILNATINILKEAIVTNQTLGSLSIQDATVQDVNRHTFDHQHHVSRIKHLINKINSFSSDN